MHSVPEQISLRCREELQLGLELDVAGATRGGPKQHLRELQQLLKEGSEERQELSAVRSPEAEPERAASLLRMLPVWIRPPMTLQDSPGESAL